ncbi:class I SAM-dependent methyltransferase [Cohnella rhizosphaerae]|uniref:Class I SAM-dependent methyltransferase n=1 Tax=Cohnella rhizosphaerae TaxID=1457232 RepID=A0A9X4QRN7_9BACL|nr:class I SAM-dependent methyltransferase [Cohnella rhizosphaerae]MDG0809246.1 class I SAM-dependent methyltransferase [Cohnella rhizosphaerae]
MKEAEYKAFYDRVGQSNGWDFSKLKVLTEGMQADIYEEVRQACKPSDLLLDIGTGGGEAVLALRDSALLLVGIDRSPGMIRTAKANLAKSGASNVRFVEMDAGQIDFPTQFFNLVTCRHAGFSARQVAKVLCQDGQFLTQQVAEGDKLNLKQAFGRGQSYGEPDGALLQRYKLELAEAGFSDIQVAEFDTAEYYRTSEDLIFLLKHTPIIPGFGQEKGDFEILRAFMEQNRTEKGIRTNAKRFRIRARMGLEPGGMRI